MLLLIKYSVYPPVVWLLHAIPNTHSNSGVAAKVLLDAGADVNTKDWDEETTLAVASALGHYNVLEVIVAHPKVQVNVQVCMSGNPVASLQ